MKKDEVNHPAHYNDGKIEHVDYAEDRGWLVHGCLYNASKYIHRAGKKGPMLTDLKKARWYLDRLITKTEQA